MSVVVLNLSNKKWLKTAHKEGARRTNATTSCLCVLFDKPIDCACLCPLLAKPIKTWSCLCLPFLFQAHKKTTQSDSYTKLNMHTKTEIIDTHDKSLYWVTDIYKTGNMATTACGNWFSEGPYKSLSKANLKPPKSHTYIFKIFFRMSTSFSTMRSSNCWILKSLRRRGVLHSGHAAEGLVNSVSTQPSHLRNVDREIRLAYWGGVWGWGGGMGFFEFPTSWPFLC